MGKNVNSAVVFVIAVLLCAALLPLAGCSTQEGPGGQVANGQAEPLAEDSSAAPTVAGMPSLPLPSTLKREASETRPSFHQKGNSVDAFVSPRRIEYTNGISEHFVTFEPDWEKGDSLEGLSYAGYSFPLFGKVNSSKRIRFFWKTPPVKADEDFYVALADYSLDRWVFQRGPEPGQEIDLSEAYENFISPWGYMYVVLIFTGHDAPSLDHMMVGESRFNFESICYPESAENQLETVVSAACTVEGGFASLYYFDFENDGVWDVYDSAEPSVQHTYDSPGIYRPRVKVVTLAGDSGESLGTAYVTNPNNIGPTAILHASALAGDAPLQVELDGDDSFDDGASQIIRCEWDMDGDNKYELNTGTSLKAETVLVRAGINKIRMRITDNDLDSAVAFVEVNIDKGFNLAELPGTKQSGFAVPLALCMIGEGVSRHPVCAYSQQSGSNYEVCFSAAETVNGSSWADSKLVTTSQSYLVQASMAEVDGNPAVAFGHYDPVTGAHTVRYSRSTGPDGDFWTLPVIAIDGTRGNVDMAVVDGNPAIVVAADQQQVGIHYVRASNALGTSWGTPLKVMETPYSNNLAPPALISLPGKEPVILCGERSAKAKYSSVTWRFNGEDLQGSSFAPREYFWDTMAEHINWTLKGDKLLFALRGYTPDFNGISFVSVDDIHSATEVSEAVLDESSNKGFSMDVAVMDGKPVIAYLKSFTIDYVQDFHLAVRFAGDFAGSNWGPEMIVDGTGETGFGVAMITTSNQKPLLVYSSEAKDSIMAAAWY